MLGYDASIWLARSSRSPRLSISSSGPSPLSWPATLPRLRFTVLYGVAVVVGYALLAATRLVWRTGGGQHDRCRQQARVLGVAALAMIGAVSLRTPFLNDAFMARWFG